MPAAGSLRRSAIRRCASRSCTASAVALRESPVSRLRSWRVMPAWWLIALSSCCCVRSRRGDGSGRRLGIAIGSLTVNPLSGLTVFCFRRLTAERCGCISPGQPPGWESGIEKGSTFDVGIEGVGQSTMARRGTSSRATIAADQRRPGCEFDCDGCRGAGGVQRPGRVKLTDGQRPGTEHFDGAGTTDHVCAGARRGPVAVSVTSRGESCVVQRCRLHNGDSGQGVARVSFGRPGEVRRCARVVSCPGLCSADLLLLQLRPPLLGAGRRRRGTDAVLVCGHGQP